MLPCKSIPVSVCPWLSALLCIYWTAKKEPQREGMGFFKKKGWSHLLQLTHVTNTTGSRLMSLCWNLIYGSYLSYKVLLTCWLFDKQLSWTIEHEMLDHILVPCREPLGSQGCPFSPCSFPLFCFSSFPCSSFLSSSSPPLCSLLFPSQGKIAVSQSQNM